MKQLSFTIASALALFMVLAAQNMLFLTTTSLLSLYKLLFAAELYCSLCLLYSALSFFSARRPVPIRHKFVIVFWPSLVFCAAVLAELDFNTLSIATSTGCAIICALGAGCIVQGFAAKKPAPHAAQALFSAREQEVISLILEGKTTQETADALFISAATVKTHLQHIYGKAQVRNRAELARFMHNHSFGG